MSRQPDRSRKPSKIFSVPISKMRVPPALVTQREFRKAHGDRIAAEMDLDKLGFPVVNHRDSYFWILDGQHRIYALKQNGFNEGYDIPCEVYENLTDQEMAEIFLGRAGKPIDSFAKFHIGCTAGHKRETMVRRIVESNGLKVSRDGGDNAIGAISACLKVLDRCGDTVLGQTLRTLKSAFVGDPVAFDASLIEGVALPFSRYNGKTNEKELATRLAAIPHGARGLIRRAEAQRERTGNQKAQCVAATVVDVYNKGAGARAKDRLPAWWKEAEE